MNMVETMRVRRYKVGTKVPLAGCVKTNQLRITDRRKERGEEMLLCRMRRAASHEAYL